MTWRSDLARLQSDLYLAQRTTRDVQVVTGRDGPRRLAKRYARRWLTRILTRGVR